MIDTVDFSNDCDVTLVGSREARVSKPNERMTMCLSLPKSTRPYLLKKERSSMNHVYTFRIYLLLQVK